jgi:drug/metabolite transporter (DMT)-like permease
VIWLLPAAGCSIAIALILKHNEIRGGDRVLLVAVNYTLAAILAFVMLGARLPRPGAAVLTLGAVTGIDYVLGFLLLMAGIARGPLAVPVTVMRLSVAVPIAASIFIWDELPGGAQWIGICLGCAAVILFGFGVAGARRAEGDGVRARGPAAPRGSSPHAPRGAGWRYGALVAGLFLVMGIGDTLLKAFRETAPDADRLVFILVLFSTAALFCWSLVIARRIRFESATAVRGLALGAANLYSTVFVLLALRRVPASVAFPFVNLTVIVGSTFLGYAVWRERIGGLSTVGIILAVAALILLPM